MGSIYRRGKVWWVKYYRDGKPYRESSRSQRKRMAERLLKQREGAIASGTFMGLAAERTTLGELAKDLVNDYKANGRKNLPVVRIHVRKLKGFFGKGTRARTITTDRIRAYMAHRRGDGGDDAPKPATVNREVSTLRRMFNLGKRAGKVAVTPHFPLVREHNIRKGWFHLHDYRRLKMALPPHLRPVVTMAYYTGMRKGEILGLTWGQIDFDRKLIRLDPGTTKNGKGRVVPMSAELTRELQQQRKLRDKEYPACRRVFFNHRTGAPIQSFRKAWQTACGKVKLDGMLFHDFRRTGVRNLVRAGVPESVAMAISGHRTRSVFDRYDIVDEADVQAAGEAVERYLEKSTGTIRAQIAEFPATRQESSHR